MTSAQIRQSFLDFFESKEHSVVPSASLMPESPNLLFTNAGMNQFVPYFLGEREAPFRRAADSQKCIRAGGKHNDLEDVGFDTYHHTFFEMLGNWSFGDYFKAEAIQWAWELLTEVWGFPKERLYATVYMPGEGEPAEFDATAYELWKAVFEAEGLDPETHIRYGGKGDNFWMMGETGPCGPCSELHIDLTPSGDSGGRLVNADSPWCIEIWNLVFMQFNANPDGSLTPLPAKHVDTGMGFERVAGILATTGGFRDFSKPPSNYNSDLFTDLFDHLAEQCGHRYAFTMPEDPAAMREVETRDCAFRVIADHVRTLCFSIADGILPGNESRNYVLRRILRRAVMFGKRLELPDGFFAALAPVVIEKMGDCFPELRKQGGVVGKVIASEETTFEKTLDRGMREFSKYSEAGAIDGEAAFTLYDTYGFPLDLTELLARERGLSVDTDGFEHHMQRQRERARAAQKKEVISVKTGSETRATRFVGFDSARQTDFQATVLESNPADKTSRFVVLDATPFYGEMGGQVGDTGVLEAGSVRYPVTDTQVQDGIILHRIEADRAPDGRVTANLDRPRRRRIERHHSATHILNWALREVLGDHIRQAGSYVGPDRLRFDFNHFEAVSDEQRRRVEHLVNEQIIENLPVDAYEIPFEQKPEDVIAVFGEKYGDVVRVVDIGGFSRELCGGTHVAATGEIGLCKIVSESGIAAGTRRIEAVAGDAAYQLAVSDFDRIRALAERLKCAPDEIEEKLESLQAQRKAFEKQLRKLEQAAAASAAREALHHAVDLRDGLKGLVARVEAPNPNELRAMAAQLLAELGDGVVVLGAEFGDKITVCANVGEAAVKAGFKAGELVRELAAQLGGKGGGKPNFAMGGAPNKGQLEAVLAAFNL